MKFKNIIQSTAIHNSFKVKTFLLKAFLPLRHAIARDVGKFTWKNDRFEFAQLAPSIEKGRSLSLHATPANDIDSGEHSRSLVVTFDIKLYLCILDYSCANNLAI